MKNRLLLLALSVLTGLLLAALFLSLPQTWYVAQASGEADFSLTILHTNDVHAHYAAYNSDGSACKDEGVCLGGTARAKTLVDHYRATEPDSILLDAGDQFQGTLYYKLFKADIVTRTMNTLGYQAMAIGNHEFDDGPAMLAKLAGGVTFPVLGTNLDVSAEPSLIGKLVITTIIPVNGEQIGLLGLTTPDTSFLAKPGNVVFMDPIDSATTAVASLEAQGVDKIIALTHLGYDQDIALAQAVNGLDVIIGGHSHTFIYTPTVPVSFTPPNYPKYSQLSPAGPFPTLAHSPNGGLVLVATEYCWEAFLGRLRVIFDGSGKVVEFQGNPIYLANTIVKDPGVVAWMAPYDAQVEVLRHTLVGTTTVNLPVMAGSEQICRTGECLLGDLVADAVLWKVNSINSPESPLRPSDSGEPYQISILNGGLLRAPLTGTISVGDVLEVLPFGNTIATFEITGTHIISALESGLSRVGTTSSTGRFPQVAGLRYTFSPWKPAGARLISVEVKTQEGYSPMNLGQIYRVVTNDYMRNGGDGYTIFKDKAINPYDFGPALDEVVQDYIKMLEVIDPEDLISGRIFRRYQFFFPVISRQPRIFIFP